MSILRLSHVEVRVPDLELATAYYCEVVGMIETARESERVFLKCWDEHQHHSVVLTWAPTHGLNHFGFKVTEAEDLDLYAARLKEAGIDVTRLGADEWAPGHGSSIRFTIPSGHSMELVHGMQQVGNLLPLTNPPPKPLNLVGIAPPRLDHLFLTAEDVGAMTDFFRDVLDFRVTEQVVGDDGFRIATWLEVSHASHDIALVTGPNGGLHHFAWTVEDWTALRDAADICAYHGVRIETNPTRHGATRGHCLYFFDPVGNRNEVFTGGYWVDPDSEPTIWTEAEMGRALFWYDGVVNQKFLTVHS
jgi:catechol 2,3-dioxygenase